MNQILSTGNDKNSNNKVNIDPIEENNYNNQFEEDSYEILNNDKDYTENNNYFNIEENYGAKDYNKSKTNSLDSKKIVIFFCIVILVFGFAIGGVAAYKMYKNKEMKNAVPEVMIEQIEGSAKISASYKKGISKIIYYWDEDQKTEIPSSGEYVEKLVDIPKGENTLTVLLVDIDGNENTFTKAFSYYTDKEKPIIELSIVEEDAKLKIKATDETEIAYITYQWNEDEPQKIYPEEEGSLELEETIEIQRGKNTLKITAVDTSNNTTSEEKGFNGVNEPEIDVYVKSGYLYMTVKHDIGIKKISYTINGKNYIFDETYENYESEKKAVKRKRALKEGENKIEIIAYSLEDTQSTYKGKSIYSLDE